ncbi:MAG: 50S ribosomal protein L16 [Vampirovibrionales bacterium]|nr:50S ribosomal protein L16 [Vampirovibrionales bacterium]
MLLPKRTKYRKHQRGRMTGTETRGVTVHFGSVGLQALEPGQITSRQIESARRAIARSIRRGGKIFIRIFPDKPITMRAAETRMGSGKGSVEYWAAIVKPGRIMFEMAGVSVEAATKALKLASQKLPIATRVVLAQVPAVTEASEAQALQEAQ